MSADKETTNRDDLDRGGPFHGASPDMIYLSHVPQVATPGKVVVHNTVAASRQTKPGMRGFRAWLAPPSREYVVCSCAWAPELGKHYRVRDR